MPVGKNSGNVAWFVVFGAALAFLLGCVALADGPGCREWCVEACQNSLTQCELGCYGNSVCLLGCQQQYDACLRNCRVLPPCYAGGGGGGDEGGGDDWVDNNPPPGPVEMEPQP